MGVLVYPTVCALKPYQLYHLFARQATGSIDTFLFPAYNITLGKNAWHRERCRSGHNGTVLKTVGGATLPWVRIPPSPPLAGLMHCISYANGHKNGLDVSTNIRAAAVFVVLKAPPEMPPLPRPRLLPG